MNFETVFESNYNYKFDVKDCLGAYMWSHMKDENCVLKSKDGSRVVFEINKKLPPIVESVFGKTISLREEANLRQDGFVSEARGQFPGTEFRSFMTFIPNTESGTLLRISIQLNWNADLSHLIKDAIKKFIVLELQNWCNDLPMHHKEFLIKTHENFGKM
jgi:hypothetical protein